MESFFSRKRGKAIKFCSPVESNRRSVIGYQPIELHQYDFGPALATRSYTSCSPFIAKAPELSVVNFINEILHGDQGDDVVKAKIEDISTSSRNSFRKIMELVDLTCSCAFKGIGPTVKVPIGQLMYHLADNNRKLRDQFDDDYINSAIDIEVSKTAFNRMIDQQNWANIYEQIQNEDTMQAKELDLCRDILRHYVCGTQKIEGAVYIWHSSTNNYELGSLQVYIWIDKTKEHYNGRTDSKKEINHELCKLILYNNVPLKFALLPVTEDTVHVVKTFDSTVVKSTISKTTDNRATGSPRTNDVDYHISAVTTDTMWADVEQKRVAIYNTVDIDRNIRSIANDRSCGMWAKSLGFGGNGGRRTLTHVDQNSKKKSVAYDIGITQSSQNNYLLATRPQMLTMATFLRGCIPDEVPVTFNMSFNDQPATWTASTTGLLKECHGVGAMKVSAPDIKEGTHFTIARWCKTDDVKGVTYWVDDNRTTHAGTSADIRNPNKDLFLFI